MKVSLNYVIFMNFKPNKILRITSNTTLIQYPNTNFTKFAKNWIIQIKFYQILNKYLFYKSKYYQIHLRTPKYWDFESFFSICEYQMLSLDHNPKKNLILQEITAWKIDILLTSMMLVLAISDKFFLLFLIGWTL